jgi:hypothetical protein
MDRPPERQQQQQQERIPGIESWIRDIPPITRIWAFACVAVGIAIVSPFMSTNTVSQGARLLIQTPLTSGAAMRICRSYTAVLFVEDGTPGWPVLEDHYEFPLLWEF